MSQLGIAAPCAKTLDSMRTTRDPSARFCSSCQERVVDLSKLTRREAEAVLRRGECVSAAYDATGDVVFRSERPRLPMLRAAVVAAPLWLLGCQQPAADTSEPSASAAPERPALQVQPSTGVPLEEQPEACELNAPPVGPSHLGEPTEHGVIARPHAPPVHQPVRPRAYPRLAGKPAFKPNR